MFCHSKTNKEFLFCLFCFFLSHYSESQTVPICVDREINLKELPVDRIMGLEVTKKADHVHQLGTILFTAWDKNPLCSHF